jgi:hypothetical protein
VVVAAKGSPKPPQYVAPAQVPSARQRRQAENCLPCHPISMGCALIIRLIIQTIRRDPTGSVWTDEASNLSRPDPSGAIQTDAEHPTRNS